jgi:catechol 2,3-dioxygenase-like lactoylglutathione lyase family enzyme
MIDIQQIDHIGIRIRDKERSVAFYKTLGFEFIRDLGYDDGHPIMMRHPSGVVLNLLGPSSVAIDENILMDIKERYAGYTHIALRVDSIDRAEEVFQQHNYPITGRIQFEKMRAIFIRDPDRNVIEFNVYA